MPREAEDRPPFANVDELFTMEDDDYIEYVDAFVDYPPDSPEWEALLHRRVVTRTRGALGQLHQRVNRQIAHVRENLTPETADGFQAWRKQMMVPRISMLETWLTLVKNVTDRNRTERREARQRTQENLNLPTGAKIDLPFGNRSNRYFLKRLVQAIYWHRRAMFEANLKPTEYDLHLWRQILGRLTYDGVTTTLDELWGSGRCGVVDWPDDFNPFNRWALRDDEDDDEDEDEENGPQAGGR